MSVTRREFLGALATSATATLLGCAGPATVQPTRPRNILFLMCDQFRFDAMRHSGDENAVTPVLDSLAATGTVLERTYCQNPICVPGRNSILLGRYSHSHGVISNLFLSSRELPSFPQVLREKGYKTACFGKLHVWGRDDLDWDLLDSGADQAKKPHPGFDSLGPVLKGGQPLGQPTPYGGEDHVEAYVKDRTIEFLERHRDSPWMVQCSFSKPHPPFQPPQRHWDLVERERLKIPEYPADDLDDVNPIHWKFMETRDLVDLRDEEILDAMQGFYGNVAFCDELFGEILEALERLGLRENTVVVFTADSGEMLYAHRLWTKFSFFEEAIRVPLIVSLPGAIRSGLRSNALVEHIDIFPTLMELLERPTPETVQGKSFVPVLEGKSAEHREFVRSEYGDTLAMQATRSYKVIDNGPDVAPEMYDLENDPREIENVAAAPERAAFVEDLVAELRAWKETDRVVTEMKGRKAAG